MKALQTIAITLVAVLVLTAAAEATTDMWTMPVFLRAGKDFACKVRNVTANPITVQMRIYNGLGTVVSSSAVLELAPFEIIGIGIGTTDSYSCRFTVPSKLYVRAGATIFALTGDDTDVLAVPAQ